VPFTLGFPELATKYKVHGSEFGLVSEAEYFALADAFMGGPKGSPTMERTRADGALVRYNEATEEFGILSGGYIRTYFKPDPAEHSFVNNRAYFLWVAGGVGRGGRG